MQKVLLFVALVSIMTGCAQKTVPTKDHTAHSSLTNTRWKLTALPALPSGLPKLNKDVFLQLDTGRIRGYGGCNNYFGAYTLQGDAITFKGIASTKMYCQETMAVEDKLFDALNNTTHYRITGTRLELLKDKDLLASFEALYLQ